jgi:hypothetical protein
MEDEEENEPTNQPPPRMARRPMPSRRPKVSPEKMQELMHKARKKLQSPAKPMSQLDQLGMGSRPKSLPPAAQPSQSQPGQQETEEDEGY